MTPSIPPPEPEHDLEQLLRRDADAIRPGAGAGFVDRVHAARATAGQPLDERLAREARAVQPGASAGFAARVRAAREAADTPIRFPTTPSERRHRWAWGVAAAAALLLALGWLAARPAGPQVQTPMPMPIAADPTTEPGPTTDIDPRTASSPTPAAPAPGLPSPDLDLAALFTTPADPLGSEIDAIGADLRQTGDFLLACLPGYPTPAAPPAP